MLGKKQILKNEDEKREDPLHGLPVNQPLFSGNKVSNRIVSSPRQAYDVCIALVESDDTKRRQEKQAVITKKYDGQRPYDAQVLKNNGQDWRANFSTNFLAGVIDRTKPQLLDPVEKADVLTYSTLPSEYADSVRKTKVFRTEITKTIRAWPAASDLMSRLGQDVILNGGAIPVRTGSDWRPQLFDCDKFFVPEKSGQHASLIPLIVLSHDIEVGELARIIEKETSAKIAGWDIEGCKRAIKHRTSSGNTHNQDSQAEKQNAQRDGASSEYKPELLTPTVGVFTLMVKDFSGQVDVWTVLSDKVAVTEDETSEGEACLLRKKIGQHETMEEAIAVFTMQAGNGHFYGSKGLGRLLTNIHIQIERGRCSAADNAWLAGMLTLENDGESEPAQVRFPFVTLPKGSKVAERQFDFSIEKWLTFDDRLTSIAESIAGAFIPPNIDNSGGATTKIEAAQKAERELAVKSGVLGRFLGHIGSLVWVMQSGICSLQNIKAAIRIQKQKQEAKGKRFLKPKVYDKLKAVGASTDSVARQDEIVIEDEQAVQCILSMLDQGLSAEEIIVLAMSSTVTSTPDQGTVADNNALTFIANNKQNPYVNQAAAAKMEATLAIGEQRAGELIIDVEDPQVEIIAARQQTMEWATMQDGTRVPAAAIDLHSVHRKKLAELMEPLIEAMRSMPTREGLTVLSIALSHYKEHIGLDQISTKEQLKNEMGVIEELTNELSKLADMAEQIEQEAQRNVTPAIGAPPSAEGEQPEQNQGDAAKTNLEVAKVALKAREIDMKEKAFEHKQKVDGVKLQGSLLQQVREQADEERARSIEEANGEKDKLK